MFTGIVEAFADVVQIESSGTNKEFWFKSNLTNELKIDQSVAHDGVCLTVVEIKEDRYRVTAINETLEKTSLSDWTVGHRANLERCLKVDGRFDGHIVQGHVDTVGRCTQIDDVDGSKLITIEHAVAKNFITVEKGSICLNGISLTVVDSKEDSFSVAIIPYTWEHTNLHGLRVGSKVNVEFDILGKYFAKMFKK